ncbi:MAG: oligosaccharide flippase family protein [bacterium]
MKFIGQLEKNFGVLFAITTLANIADYLFHLYMGRHLSPADYGILYSLITLLIIVSVPTITIRTVMARYVSHFMIKNEYGKVRSLLFSSFKVVFLGGLLGFLVFSFASGQIAQYLQIPSRTPVIILGVIVLITVIMPVGRGALQGLEKFGHLGLNFLSQAGLKLGSGIVLVYFGFKVNGALAAFILGGLAALFLLLRPLNFFFHGKELAGTVGLKKIYQYSAPVIIAISCLWVMVNVDVILVKHFFKPLEAGYYSAAALVGRVIFFLPESIGIVMFPKTSQLHVQRRKSFFVLKKTLLFVGLLAGGAATGCILFPSFVTRILWGTKYSSSAPLVGRFALAMTLFSLANVLFLYQLSIHSFRFLYLAGIFAISEIVAITIFHSSLSQVVWILVANATVLFLLNLLIVFVRQSMSIPEERCSST